MTTAAAPAAQPGRPAHGAGRILLVVFGSIVAPVALGLLVGGFALVWANETQRDADGYFTTSTELFSTGSYALTHEGVELSDVSELPDWIADRLGTIRVRATSEDGEPLFIGIGSSSDVAAFLRGVGHDEVTDVEYDPFRTEIRRAVGGPPPWTPADQRIWTASASGPGTQTATWEVAPGTWSLVVMNADGARGVAADVEFGAQADWLLAIGLVLATVGVLIGLGSAAMIFFGVRTPTSSGGDGSFAAAIGPAHESREAPYPVAVEARLDEPLSRWLWLLKIVLVIPHAVCLAFLWMAFAVLTLVAFFAILFTGRYPRSIFDFNVGVLRWTWRVDLYTFGGFATDRYPPFTLGPVPDYPATLEIPYPEQLSRGLVLVKSWLLAIPHLIIVAIFAGGAFWGWIGRDIDWPGLIPILAVVAGVVLLFRGRYPRDVLELLVGLNRWVFRVIAYVALMRDEYPPFRLER